MSMGGRLQDKVVWVTGAGRGLGRAVASALHSEGASVVATARNVDDLLDLQKEHGAERIRIAPASVTDSAEIAEVAEGIASRGRLDGLVNCAGISPSFVRSEFVERAVFEELLATNTTGTFTCAQAAGSLMLDQGGGSIVNVGSVHARVGFARIAAYAASKGAVDALTKTLAVEWADRNVRVNTLTPGYFPTDLSRRLLDSSWGADIVRRIPMGRTGEPHELGKAAVFLISDESSYMTGADITIDGGWQAW